MANNDGNTIYFEFASFLSLVVNSCLSIPFHNGSPYLNGIISMRYLEIWTIFANSGQLCDWKLIYRIMKRFHWSF